MVGDGATIFSYLTVSIDGAIARAKRKTSTEFYEV